MHAAGLTDSFRSPVRDAPRQKRGARESERGEPFRVPLCISIFSARRAAQTVVKGSGGQLAHALNNCEQQPL